VSDARPLHRAGEARPEAEISEILARRRERWSPRSPRHSRGILSLYERVATSASHGASLVT
jgi:dihydroxyacid dehydratase/phosphogluconate dehydratase